MKRVLIVVALAMSFTVGFAISAHAYGAQYYGYFTGAYDSSGDDVLQNNANDGYSHYNGSTGAYDAIPPSITTPDQFITFIHQKLASTRVDFSTANNATNWDRTGAQFIVATMLGIGYRPGAAELQDWDNRVRHARDLGHINMNTYVSSWPNTFYQISRNDSSSSVNDVAWWYSGASGQAIVFYKDDGSVAYILRRNCANPLGDPLPLTAATWSAVGSTVVTSSTGPAPGDTNTEISVLPGAHLNFRHSIYNNGPATADIWYETFGRDSGLVPNKWTGQYFNNVSLSGAPTFTRQDQNIAFDWGLGSPGPGIPVDNFSIRWTKTDTFNAGTYWFTVVGDDGVRVYIDGALKIDAWIAQGATSYTYSQAMTAGSHTIQVDYFESGGPGYTRFDYSDKVTRAGTDGGWFGGASGRTVWDEGVDVPSNAPSGAQFCRRVLWDWKNSSAAGDSGLGSAGFGYQACATVTGNYTLVPTVVASTPSGGNIAQQGDTVSFTYNVQNTGTTDGTNISCSISGTGSPPSTNCPKTFTAGATGTATASPESIVIGSQPAGSQICRWLAVNPGSSGGGQVVSSQVCITIAKKPYVHFFGGDVWAGGGFTDATGNCTTNTGAKITTVSNTSSGAGSVGEYGVFALSSVNLFGSGGKPLYNPADFADLGRRLTFANNTSTLGKFGAPQHCIDDRSAAYASAPAISGTVNLATQPSGAWHAAGSLTIAGTLPAGSKQVYYVDGDVTINGNINYISSNPTYSSPSQIPSLLIIAKGNINVDQAVSNLDGMYITRGTFFTCYQKPSPPSNTTCNVQLTVNGSVIANSLDLYRTFGGDGATTAARQTPAEIFNLSPELFLNNVLNNSANASISTSDSRELPPRF